MAEAEATGGNATPIATRVPKIVATTAAVASDELTIDALGRVPSSDSRPAGCEQPFTHNGGRWWFLQLCFS